MIRAAASGRHASDALRQPCWSRQWKNQRACARYLAGEAMPPSDDGVSPTEHVARADRGNHSHPVSWLGSASTARTHQDDGDMTRHMTDCWELAPLERELGASEAGEAVAGVYECRSSGGAENLAVAPSLHKFSVGTAGCHTDEA